MHRAPKTRKNYTTIVASTILFQSILFAYAAHVVLPIYTIRLPSYEALVEESLSFLETRLDCHSIQIESRIGALESAPRRDCQYNRNERPNTIRSKSR